jgi:Pyruvate/2-oxoacid:ferredoxin oxidoreductase delta subunit
VKLIRLPQWIKPSTRAFWRAGRRKQDYSLFDWLHGYIYGRWLYLYIGIGVGEQPLARRLACLWGPAQRALRAVRGQFDGVTQPEAAQHSPSGSLKITFADTYHGKVVPLQAACELVQVNEPISLPNLEQVIPYQRARDLILMNPDHIVALECPCRSAREHPCLPLDVCLVVGEPFASFVIEHQPSRSRWITQQEAVTILQAEDERGHVHHAFFKDAMLGRFYAICNCCSCCCGAMQAQRNGTPMLASSGYRTQVDEDSCTGCGTCVDFCQFNALTVQGFTVKVSDQACMGCGICLSKCPQEALSLVRAPERGEPLELHDLMAQLLNSG